MDGCSPWKIGDVTQSIIDRNHHLLGYVPIKLTRMGCLMFMHRRDSYATLLPEILFLHFCSTPQHFKPKSFISNFGKLPLKYCHSLPRIQHSPYLFPRHCRGKIYGKRGNIIRKEVVNDDVVNPTRFTPNFAAEEEDEKINDCLNGFVWF